MILSICIPTYNREKEVLNQLSFLKKETKNISKGVEILVSDNNSNKNIKESLALYKSQNQFYSFYQQNENLGLIGNSLFLLNKTNKDSKYVWFIGDDDLLEEGIVHKILEIVKKHDSLKYIFLNHDFFKEDINNKFGASDFKEIEGFNENSTEKFLKILNQKGTIQMFMSSGIFHKETLLEGYANFKREPQIDDFLLFAYICLTSGASYIVNEIFLHDKIGEATWSKSATKIFAYSVPSRIIEFENLGINKKKVKSSLFKFYSKGRGNFIFMVFYAPSKIKFKLLNYLGFFNILFLSFISIYINIKRVCKSIIS